MPSEAVLAPSPPPVHSDPEIFGGETVFFGTRVPLKIMIEHIAAGVSLDEFLEDFPTVTRSQAVAALQLMETAAIHANLA